MDELPAPPNPAYPTLEALRSGDRATSEAAWEIAYAHLWECGMSVARRLLAGSRDASAHEDIVAEAVTAVMKHVLAGTGSTAKFTMFEDVLRFMVTVTRLRSSDFHRRRVKGPPEISLETMDIDVSELVQPTETSMGREGFDLLIAGIDPPLKKLFEDVYIHGMRVREAASKNGLTENQAHTRLFLARQHLRKSLESPGKAVDKLQDGEGREDWSAEPEAKAGTTTADPVRFSAFLPGRVRAGGSFVLDVWAYLESQRDGVLARAKKRADVIEGAEAGPAPVRRGTELTFHVWVEGCEVTQPLRSVWWVGTPANAGVRVHVPATAGAGPYAGCVTVLNDGMPAMELHFDVETGGEEGGGGVLRESMEKRIVSIFASYASADRPEVVTWKRGAEVTGTKVFLDAASLREGEDWEKELWRHVPTKDLFCLFWSKAASESAWVAKEWQCALRERGIEYIRPVPMADPRDVPPPPELSAHKHFNDMLWVLYEYEKRRREER